MDHGGSKSSCTLWCMIIGGAIGLIAFLLLWLVIDWRLLSALMLGAVIAAIGAVVFPLIFCGNSTGPVEAGTAGIGAGNAPSPADKAPTAAAPTAASTAASAVSSGSSAAVAAPSASASTAATKPASAAAVTPSKFLAGEAELAEKKGEWKYEAEAKPAAKKAAKSKPAAKSAAKSSTTKAAASKSAGAKPAPKAKADPVAKDGQPPLLSEARAGGADDLKQIKGVGPGLEKTLNELGFFHFDQIAAWRKKEIEWVDSRLKFKGRIVRDEWIKQCKGLAKGQETEFSERVKKGEVY